jgi:hypothetical protein
LLSSDALRGFYSDLEAGGLDARNRRRSEIEEWDDPLSFIIILARKEEFSKKKWLVSWIKQPILRIEEVSAPTVLRK